ncbi:MAG: putative baseplate assembly protein, partial [Tardiphaga sp.]
MRELARLIGYQLAPGVGAGTALAFTLEAAPGAPALAAQPVTIPIGTRVQSVPDPDQTPQTFETTAAFTGRVEWNAIPAAASQRTAFCEGLTEVYLAGTNLQIQPGDALAVVASGGLRELRWAASVEPDAARGITRVRWPDPLGSTWPHDALGADGVRVFTFRQRAALFGNNAPDPRLIFTENNPDNNGLTTETGAGMTWANFAIDTANQHIDLDATYPKIAAGSWIALVADDPAGAGSLVDRVGLYHVDQVSHRSRTDFGISAKITRVKPDSTTGLSNFGLRETVVLGQSEELQIASRPLAYPVYGSMVVLGQYQPDLSPGQLIAVSGMRQRVKIGPALAGITLTLDDGTERTAAPGQLFFMRAPPERLVAGNYQALDQEELDPASVSSETMRWHLEDTDGAAVTADAPAGSLQLQPAGNSDLIVSEVRAIVAGDTGVLHSISKTLVNLSVPLQYCYDRPTVSINANVAPATHGETVSEIAGSGDAGRGNQSFLLKQGPLTYVSTPAAASGCASTLQVRINDLLWQDAPTLYGRDGLERIFALRQDEDGRSTVKFGDGSQGARLPSGQNNVRLTYRKGLGAAGNLRANQLSMLMTRPLGVKAATNPVPATGGQNPELLADARTNAPLRVLTLDRAVSVQDYINFARAFAGIAKAFGVWISDGHARGVHLTVAGPNGAKIPSDNDTLKNLIGALHEFGDVHLPLSVQSFASATFKLGVKIKIVDDAEEAKVLGAVKTALRTDYSFEAREFGQPVTLGEIYATIHAVPGVVAADINMLYRKGKLIKFQKPQPRPRLFATLPVVQSDG